MKRLIAVCISVLTLVGCESHPITPYVSPRVTGRVLAADTKQPLANAKIISGRHSTDLSSPPKGGQVLATRPAVRTDRDGRFLLVSERVLGPFSGAGWFSLQLLIEQAGYERFITNYSRLNLRTNTWKGEPSLDAGDILLVPAPK
jgi:hypothetical protein